MHFKNFELATLFKLINICYYRHFMELVCTGLSKNPYITSQRKKDTIFWFKVCYTPFFGGLRGCEGLQRHLF